MHKGNAAQTLSPDSEEDYKNTVSPSISKTASKDQSVDDWGEFENQIAQDLEKTQISSVNEDEDDQYRVVKTVAKKKSVAITRKTPSGHFVQTEEASLPSSNSSASVNSITNRLMNNETNVPVHHKKSTTAAPAPKKKQQNGEDYFEEWGSWEEGGNSKQHEEEEEPSWNQDFSDNQRSNNYNSSNTNYSSNSNNSSSNNFVYDPNFTPSQHTMKSANPERFRGIGSSSSMTKSSSRSMNRNIFDLDMDTLKDMPPEDIAWYLKETAKVKGAVIAEKATELGSIALEKGKEVSSQVSQWLSNWMNGQ